MISILMAAYNGEKYIAEQIDSILSQTVQDFTLFITDDCSTDRTFEILKEYAARKPDKIKIRRNDSNSGGAKENFLRLLSEHTHDEHVMLADQDDIWKHEKIKVTLEEMRIAEGRYGEVTPILVHTDLTVVDADGTVASSSLNKALDLEMEKTTLISQVVQNTVTGCTVMVNAALMKLFRTAEQCIMDDWWLGLIATAFGKRMYLPECTVLYRQHGSNSVGAKQVRSFRYMVRKLFNPQQTIEKVQLTYIQARTFQTIYSDLLDDEQKRILAAYTAIPQYNKIQRCSELRRIGALRNGFFQKAGQFFFI